MRAWKGSRAWPVADVQPLALHATPHRRRMRGKSEITLSFYMAKNTQFGTFTANINAGGKFFKKVVLLSFRTTKKKGEKPSKNTQCWFLHRRKNSREIIYNYGEVRDGKSRGKLSQIAPLQWKPSKNPRKPSNWIRYFVKKRGHLWNVGRVCRSGEKYNCK